MAFNKFTKRETMAWAMLTALRSLGGVARIDQLDSTVIEREDYPDGLLDMLHGEGPQTELDYRFKWARTHLRILGLISNTRRGVWVITPEGEEISEQRLIERFPETRKKSGKARKAIDAETAAQIEAENAWKGELTRQMVGLKPDEFEKLVVLLLLEHGFETAETQGGAGDQGIDGVGVYRLGLLTFNVYFQCKRYAENNTVTPHDVRDFRGAMEGRGDQGLFITTSRFTVPAEEEATRPGARTIDLIEGSKLCDLMKEVELGVKVIDGEVVIDKEFFASGINLDS